MVAKMTATFDDVIGPPSGRRIPLYIIHLVEHITGFLLKVSFDSHRPSLWGGGSSQKKKGEIKHNQR